MDVEEILAGARELLREEAEQRPFRNIAAHESAHCLVSLITSGPGHIARVWRYPQPGTSGGMEWRIRPKMTVRQHSVLVAAGAAGERIAGFHQDLCIQDREQFRGNAIENAAKDTILWHEAVTQAHLLIEPHREFFDLLVRLLTEHMVVEGCIIDRLWLDHLKTRNARNLSGKPQRSNRREDLRWRDVPWQVAR
jgi:hypothetical protein